jgi:hypothetical protein
LAHIVSERERERNCTIFGHGDCSHTHTPKCDVIGVCLSKGKRKRGKKIAIDDDYEIVADSLISIKLILLLIQFSHLVFAYNRSVLWLIV